MARSQTKEERDAFFAHLEQLGESDGDSDGEVVILSERNVKKSRAAGTSSRSNLSPIVTKASQRRTTMQHPLDQTISKSDSTRTPILVTKTAKVTKTNHTKPPAPTTKHNRNSKSTNDTKLVAEADRMFAGLTFYFIPNDDVAKPRKIRIRTAISHGATWARTYTSTVTHVIVDHRLDFDAAQKALPSTPALGNTFLVRDTWLIDSVAYKNVQRPLESRFKVKGAPEILHQPIGAQVPAKEKPASMAGRKRKLEKDHPDVPYDEVTSKNEFDRIVQEVQKTSHLPLDGETVDDRAFESVISHSDEDEILTTSKENAGFQCMEKNDGSKENPNARTIDVLQDMSTYYEQTGDRWRTLAYRKAIGALKKQTTLIRTRDQALTIPQIGARLADKIEEIVTTNRLKSLESAQENPDAQTLQLFMDIYGVGLVQATNWISQGHRSLEDLTTKVKLSNSQKVGIAHYEDFKQRIPRAEVAEHADVVRKALRKVDIHLDATIGGSYRRGNADSGDIDLIITKQDATIESIRTLMIDSVIPDLEASGFLKVALASSTSRDHGSKWHGASCLPGKTTWRRIDLLFVPWSELGAAMIYFTGNDIFNRSLRLLASRKGMRLNQHGLYADVMRGKGRVKMNEGNLLEGHSETKIFEILGVPWRPPEHRKC